MARQRGVKNTEADSETKGDSKVLGSPKKEKEIGSPGKKKVMKPSASVSNASTCQSSMGKTASRWLTSLARQNFIYFAEKLQKLDTKNKVRALRMMRLRMKSRFMKVFRLYRYHKYGEPIGPPLPKSKKLSSKGALNKSIL